VDQQARTHKLDVGLLEWDFDLQIGLHRRFAFELLMPVRVNIIRADYEDASGLALPEFESIHHRDETIYGVGDVVWGTRVGLVRPENVKRWLLDLQLGMTFPTGRIEPNPYVLGARGERHQHMFFGNGTFDPVTGLQSVVLFDKWSLVGWLSARTPLYENRLGYRPNHVVVAGIGALSGFGLERWSFLLQPEVFHETTAKWEGRDARNSGRTSLIATGGVFVRPGRGFQIHLLAKIPYVTFAHGGILRWPFVAMLGFTWIGEPWSKR
jgi:hypothetical protein